MDAMQKFVIDYMGQKYVEPPPFDLKACYEDSGPVTPLVFVLSTGSDPFAGCGGAPLLYPPPVRFGGRRFGGQA